MVPPHTLGVPLPPQAWEPEHVPQLMMLPQPSVASPQLKPCCTQVFAVHWRRLVEVLVDFFLISGSFLAAYAIRFGWPGTDTQRMIRDLTLPVVLGQEKVAPEVPARNFARGQSSYEAPPADGSGVTLGVSPTSERLQIMEPWPAWDGKDFEDMPVLLKTKGKTTTDHISPAGPWLRYRGHLGKFSDNMFLTAINAYTGEAGKGKNVLTGETSQPISKIARDYKAKGVKWVVVGDHNYGEGSSREHAALGPRYLGLRCVIAKSFARIHWQNLINFGILPLTFANPDDWAKISGKKGERIVYIRTLVTGGKGNQAGKSIDTIANTGQYL